MDKGQIVFLDAPFDKYGIVVEIQYKRDNGDYVLLVKGKGNKPKDNAAIVHWNY